MDHFDVQSLKRILPLQNPLYSFLHNNVLQAFEGLEFFEGLERASKLYRARTLPSGDYYRSAYRKKRIREDLLKKEIEIYREQHPECPCDSESIFKVLIYPIKYKEKQPFVQTLRSSEYWETKYGRPFQRTLQEFLVPIVQSYLDQGQALIRNPFQQHGLLEFFRGVVEHQPFHVEPFPKRALKFLQKHNAFARESDEKDEFKKICQSAHSLGVEDSRIEDFLSELAFDLKGWSGMIHRLESDPDQTTLDGFKVKLLDWLWIRVAVEGALHETYCLDQWGHWRAIKDCRLGDVNPIYSQGQKILEVCASAGIRYQSESLFLEWLLHFGRKDRFIIWQRAYEASFRCLSHEKIRKGYSTRHQPVPQPKAKFLFCIDDREESLRRHLEKLEPAFETSGVVGFFGLDMSFTSRMHPKPTRQCPPVVEPRHSARERAENSNGMDSDLDWRWSIYVYRATRSLFRGYLASLTIGFFSIFYMAFRVLFPKATFARVSQIRSLLREQVPTRIETDFSPEEKATIVESICRMAGMVSETDFTRIIYLVSHGSTANNNPYRQAYGCGACSGNSGESNSRVFCEFANDPSIRERLKARKFIIPDRTYFVPLHHDTCSDDVRLISGEMPDSLRDEVHQTLKIVSKAAELNAKERLERLEPESQIDPHLAKKQVKERALDLAQPRPEYGHSSVAMAVFAPRSWTRQIDLDRRSFLVSYDSEKDPEGKVLREVLVGALPVCANIGLDYFFSASDPDRMGSGSKLPLNVTSLLGVMTGSLSDLRLGLARQMTEVHEPLRVQVYIDSPEEILRSTILSHPRLEAIVRQEWVQVFRVDRATGEIEAFKC